jgi:hypothetical protein
MVVKAEIGEAPALLLLLLLLLLVLDALPGGLQKVDQILNVTPVGIVDILYDQQSVLQLLLLPLVIIAGNDTVAFAPTALLLVPNKVSNGITNQWMNIIFLVIAVALLLLMLRHCYCFCPTRNKQRTILDL